MNRRGFFSTLAKAAAGFTILPAATTYERIWRVQRGHLPVRQLVVPLNMNDWPTLHPPYAFVCGGGWKDSESGGGFG